MKSKSIYTKAHFGELTFAQMPYKDTYEIFIKIIYHFSLNLTIDK